MVVGGDDFYGWCVQPRFLFLLFDAHARVPVLAPRRFLGPRMIYTSGIIRNPDIEETLEQLQDNKLAVVCNKLNLQPTDRWVSSLYDRFRSS
jgi:hypothetical protein